MHEMDREGDESGSRARLGNYGFAERMRRGDTYGLLLLAILFTYAFMALLEDSRWGRPVITIMLAGTVLLALHTSHARRRLMRFALAVTAITVILAVAHAVTGGTTTPLKWTDYLVFVVAGMVPVVITARIVRHPVVNLETIFGAVCAYMLIGMLFAGFYRAANALGSVPFFIQVIDPSPVEYLYFSFITLTTLGFGDLTPATDPGRILVSLEALIGQVFLVTIVASLVASFGQERTVPSR